MCKEFFQIDYKIIFFSINLLAQYDRNVIHVTSMISDSSTQIRSQNYALSILNLVSLSTL